MKRVETTLDTKIGRVRIIRDCDYDEGECMDYKIIAPDGNLLFEHDDPALVNEYLGQIK